MCRLDSKALYLVRLTAKDYQIGQSIDRAAHMRPGYIRLKAYVQSRNCLESPDQDHTDYVLFPWESVYSGAGNLKAFLDFTWLLGTFQKILGFMA